MPALVGHLSWFQQEHNITSHHITSHHITSHHRIKDNKAGQDRTGQDTVYSVERAKEATYNKRHVCVFACSRQNDRSPPNKIPLDPLEEHTKNKQSPLLPDLTCSKNAHLHTDGLPRNQLLTCSISCDSLSLSFVLDIMSSARYRTTLAARFSVEPAPASDGEGVP